MQDRNKYLHNITVCAVISVIAAIIGILESLLPLQLLIPIPGVKLGIGNILIILAFRFLGAKSALSVIIVRVFIIFAATGNMVSLILSLSGGIFSFIILLFMMKLYNRTFSFIGISACSAVFHGIGQLSAACFIIGHTILFYLPIMCIACAVTGVFTGTLANAFEKVLSSYLTSNQK